ncbi:MULTISPECIES: hypothetical protein [Gemmobacter]|uniref:Uncharacterized protein n=2 Tax=Gemmobacter TaxID=204456 RepID=A0A2T6B4V8_9RHOB|nr:MULTISPECIES: hypothetical protein [Gemmobacter]PTX51094.1 hypothetical protein C8N34_104213 [Gemmobacter caeni]TWJ01094.1 hypothetical protein IQ03_01810 [Gemmobacter caeni]GHC18361.1 hypothetical protein GCM10007291_16280 [Gemmobacter nanjingensis]
MQNTAPLSSAEVERMVQAIGTPVSAPMVMPKQILEAPHGGLLRGLMLRLHLLASPRQGL